MLHGAFACFQSASLAQVVCVFFFRCCWLLLHARPRLSSSSGPENVAATWAGPAIWLSCCALCWRQQQEGQAVTQEIRALARNVNFCLERIMHRDAWGGAQPMRPNLTRATPPVWARWVLTKATQTPTHSALATAAAAWRAVLCPEPCLEGLSACTHKWCAQGE